jgi:hypothetical protein
MRHAAGHGFLIIVLLYFLVVDIFAIFLGKKVHCCTIHDHGSLRARARLRVQRTTLITAVTWPQRENGLMQQTRDHWIMMIGRMALRIPRKQESYTVFEENKLIGYLARIIRLNVRYACRIIIEPYSFWTANRAGSRVYGVLSRTFYCDPVSRP